METSILQKIRKKAGKWLEPQFLKTGQVLETRAWPASPMIEIDLHLPASEMQQWTEVPYIKFQVGDLAFRDYTPFGWDADTSTCSLLVDTAHEGPGSRWAKSLSAGQTVKYLKAGTTRQLPHLTNLVVALGDNSSLAHLLALQQLTMPRIRFEGAILSDSLQTGLLCNDYFNSSFTTHTDRNELSKWLKDGGYCFEHTSFYITGNNDLVTGLRKLLKSIGHPNVQVKGFWH